MIHVLIFLNIAILIYFAFMGLGHTALLIASFPDIWRKFQDVQYGNISELLNKEQLIPVTIIIPAYNEENRILNCVLGLLNSQYKNIKIIIVSDGSVDNTLPLLIEKFSLYEVPGNSAQKFRTALIRHYYQSATHPIMVLDKEKNGSADAINAGLNLCKTPIFLTVDADTILEPQALTRVVLAYLSKPHCICVGGAVYVLNENKIQDGKVLNPIIPRGYVPSVQVPEYLRSFQFGRSGWNSAGGALCYPGAFTLFETRAVQEVGGFDTGNTSYDFEIIVKLQEKFRENKTPCVLYFAPEAFAWTEVPATLKRYWRQRNLWQRGIMRGMFLHKKMFFNPKYGVVGLCTYPFYLAFETFGGFVEATAYLTLLLALYLHLPNIMETALLFVALAWGFMAFITAAVGFLNLVTFNKYLKFSGTIHVFGLSLLEMIGFRQYGVFCRFFATFQYFFNRLRGKIQ